MPSLFLMLLDEQQEGLAACKKSSVPNNSQISLMEDMAGVTT